MKKIALYIGCFLGGVAVTILLVGLVITNGEDGVLENPSKQINSLKDAELSTESMKSEGKSIVSSEYLPKKLRGSTSITCTYPQSLSSYYFENQVTHELPKPETNPIVITFADFDLENRLAIARFIDATQSIQESLLGILDIDDEKIIMVEGLGSSYTTVHTVFLKEGVSLMSKQSYIFGLPSSNTMMGTCKDY